MTYNRGSNSVWDRLAQTTGDNGWSWSSMEQYYMKVRSSSQSIILPRLIQSIKELPSSSSR